MADPGNGNGGGSGNGHGNSDHENNGHGNSAGGNGNGGVGGGNGNGNAGGNGKGNGNGKADKGDDGDGTSGSSGDDGSGDQGSGGAISSERLGNGRDRIVRSEIVVAEADQRLGAFARDNGFRILRTDTLAALGLTVTRLQAPDGVSASQARRIIAQAFPAAIVDFNHLYQPQTSVSLPAPDYAAKAVHWSPQLKTCGATTHLGLIDTAVAWSVPILKDA